MNLTARILLTILSAAAVVAAFSLDLDGTGPGLVTAVHAQVEELDGGRNCVACHGTGPTHLAGAAGVNQLAQACLECHAEIADQRERGRGIHGQLEPSEKNLCGSCHAEHLGSDLKLTGARAFRLAGLTGPEGFDHGTLDFQLHGRHDALACVDCHPHADQGVLAEGEKRFLGKAQTCIECHEDVHEGAMKRGCESCHGQEHAFDDLGHFPHDSRFPLHGSHQGLSCASCHEAESEYSVEALSDPKIGQDPQRHAWRACASCHESPHDAAFLDGVPLPDLRPGPGRDGCALCHSEQHSAWTGSEPIFDSAWHAASGFALETPHAKLDCAQCHPRDAGQSFADAYPGRAAEQCASCHQDLHQGQFDHDPSMQNNCLACHQQDRFTQHEFDVAAHAQTRFALEQSHTELDCALCHDAFLPAQEPSGLASHADPCRVFRGTSRSCEACHQDAHSGAFAQLESELGDFPGGNCARCHDAGTFSKPFEPFDHLRWTGFALELGHATESCEDCHARTALPDETGRRLGRVADLFPGDPAACQACHDDVHRGAFAESHLPRELSGRIGCDRCHTTGEFLQLHQEFDHGAWTGYVLDGAHAQADCASCHGSGTEPRSLGFVRDHFAGDPALCSSCHEDPHDAIFDRKGLPHHVQGRQDCARCHESRSFQAAALGAFDHGFWTGFRLQGKHALAQCNACHEELEKPTDRGRSYARARGKSCADCHVDPHVAQFARDGKTNCLQCHDATAQTWVIPSFDHSTTRFALDATHQKLACADCHPRTSLESGGDAVRYRPLGMACADCHTVLPGPIQEGGGK